MLTVKELQEWEHYDAFIEIRREEFKDEGETTEKFLAKVEAGKYEDLAHVVIATTRFATRPEWKAIWWELVDG